MTRRDWSMVAAALKRTRMRKIDGNKFIDAALTQHDADCWSLAAAFKQEADKQGQKFDPARFIAECGAGS